MKVSRVILIIILFIAFFEIGIFSSYTIVTSEVPDIQELIDMQINTISSIFSAENVSNILIKDPEHLNVTNKFELADALSSKAEVDGINVDSMNVTTSEDTNGNFTVEITALGYSSAKGKSSAIYISGEPNYKIIASAKAVNGVKGVVVDITTIQIDSILKLYDENENMKTIDMNSSSSKGSSSKSSSKSYSSNSYSSSSSSSDSTSSSSGSSSQESSGGSSSSGSSSSDSTSSGEGLEITVDVLNPLFVLF